MLAAMRRAQSCEPYCPALSLAGSSDVGLRRQCISFAALKYGEALANDGKIAFVEVTKRRSGRLSLYSSANQPGRILSLLQRDLRDTRQCFAILIEGGRIADDEDFRDVNHLNGDGRVRMTERLAKALKSYLK